MMILGFSSFFIACPSQKSATPESKPEPVAAEKVAPAEVKPAEEAPAAPAPEAKGESEEAAE